MTSLLRSINDGENPIICCNEGVLPIPCRNVDENVPRGTGFWILCVREDCMARGVPPIRIKRVSSSLCSVESAGTGCCSST